MKFQMHTFTINDREYAVIIRGGFIGYKTDAGSGDVVSMGHDQDIIIWADGSYPIQATTYLPTAEGKEPWIHPNGPRFVHSSPVIEKLVRRWVEAGRPLPTGEVNLADYLKDSDVVLDDIGMVKAWK